MKRSGACHLNFSINVHASAQGQNNIGEIGIHHIDNGPRGSYTYIGLERIGARHNVRSSKFPVAGS